MSERGPRAWAERQARAADEALLVKRLARLGSPSAVGVHENRTVLVSLTNSGTLRVHRGFAYAPDRVLTAVLAFVDSSTNSGDRRIAERRIKGFSVDAYVRPVRRRPARARLRPGDRQLLEQLRRMHERLNAERFGGALPPIKFRVSHRMRRRLGELVVDSDKNHATEIAISVRHLRRDGWGEIEHTVLHEMVHQWQAESGIAIDHGPTFRRKAVEVGVLPRADRLVGTDAAVCTN